MHAEALHAALETVAPLTAALEPLTAALAPHLAPLAAAARSQAEPFLAPALDAFSAASTALGGPARQLRVTALRCNHALAGLPPYQLVLLTLLVTLAAARLVRALSAVAATLQDKGE